MTRAAAIVAMCFLSACGKPTGWEQATVTTHGSKLPDLVFAANAPVFDPGGVPFVEAVWADGVWKIHDDGVWIADGADEDAIYESMKAVWDKRPDSRILISAEKDTLFREITTLIRGAARTGFWRMNFLVNTGATDSENHAFLLELPTIDGGKSPPGIDPFVISLNARGAVFIGAGAGRYMTDSETADLTLPGLSSKLLLFAEAARAAGCRPVCQVHADPGVNYQRVIDLLSLFHDHQVVTLFSTIAIKPPGMNERIELHRKLKSKPLPPKDNRTLRYLWEPNDADD